MRVGLRVAMRDGCWRVGEERVGENALERQPSEGIDDKDEGDQVGSI